jgi:hypothetical protein
MQPAQQSFNMAAFMQILTAAVENKNFKEKANFCLHYCGKIFKLCRLVAAE